jgi:RES domain-containing protein
MQVWRICRARFVAAAFRGEGALRYGGRWNPPKVAMVYTATNRALAAMEFFVNMDSRTPASDLMICSLEVPDSEGFVQRLDLRKLPHDWRDPEHPALKKIGADWLISKRSLALEVPSAAVQGEWNVLLNPAHPVFKQVKIGKPEPFAFDDRMCLRKT